MNKLSFALLCVLMCSSVLADEIPIATEEHLNGRGWGTLDQNSKIFFVTGLKSGIRAFVETAIDASPKQSDTDTKVILETNSVLLVTTKLLDPQITNEDLVYKLDVFYSNNLNLNIPVWEAHRLITTTHFVKQDPSEEAVKGLRSKYER